jgi:hypothetical protein
MMMLLSDGSVLVQDGKNTNNGNAGGQSASIFKLSPQVNTGSYVNGAWSGLQSMNEARLFFTTATLPDGRIFAVGGEFPTFSNTAEIYDPVANTWTFVDSVPTADSSYGDDPIEVIPTGPNSGQILAGYYNSRTTYRFNPAAAAGSQWTQTAGAKMHFDRSDEEAWVKLKDGSILSYDIFASGGGTFQAQRYVPSTDTWVDASTLSGVNPPSILESNGAQGRELGPAFLQPDGNVIYFGANGNTAIYNPTTNIWTAGPAEPTKVIGGVTTNIVGTDDPGAVLPNGHILIALSPQGTLNAKGNYTFPSPSYIYDYDPVGQTFTDVSPGGGLGGTTISGNAFALNMVVLPSGQVLLSNEGDVFQVFTEDPATGPQNSWKPAITKIIDSGGGTYTLTGTQLNGIDEGSNYGDDNESASNYPIIRFTDASGNVFYGRTFNWSSTSVATDATPVTVQFTLPSGQTLSNLKTVTLIANGIPSDPIPFHIAPNLTPPGDQASDEGATHTFDLGSFNDPDGGSWLVDVDWGDGTGHASIPMASPGTIPPQTHAYGEEGPYKVIETVTDTSDSQSDTKTFAVNVSDPPVVQASAITITPAEGAAFTGSAFATFNDPGEPEPNKSDSAGTLSDHYKVDSIDWGDGGAPDTTSGAIIFDGVSTFTVSGSHTYGEEGPYTIKAVINHEGIKTTLKSTAKVSDPAVLAKGIDVSAKECIAFNLPVASFTDPGGAEPNASDNVDGIPSHYTASVDFGDGKGASPGVITYNGVPLDGSKTNTFTVTAMHTFDEEGTYSVTVTIDHEGVKTTVTSTAAVRDNYGLLLLDPSGSKSLTVTGNGSVTVTNCGAIVVDSTDAQAIFLTGNAAVSADGETDVTGGLGINGLASLTTPEINHDPATPDPFALGLPPAPSTTFTAVHFSAGSHTLSPGTYTGGIAIDGTAAVTLLSGIYYIDGGGFAVGGLATVTDNDNGVLIVNAPRKSSDTIRFDAQASVHLNALSGQSGALAPYNHFTIFQDPASANTITVAGKANVAIKGIVYAPRALLKLDGNGTATVSTDTNPTGGVVVAFDATVAVNASLTINADPPDFIVPADAPSAGRAATVFTAVVFAAPSSAARSMQISALGADNLAFTSLVANSPSTTDATVNGSLSARSVPVRVTATPVLLSAAPFVVSSPANGPGAGRIVKGGTSDASLVGADQQPAQRLVPATLAQMGEPPLMLPSEAHEAAFAAMADNAAVAAADIVGGAPEARGAAEATVVTPSLLGALCLALGLAGYWPGAGRPEDEPSRRNLLR